MLRNIVVVILSEAYKELILAEKIGGRKVCIFKKEHIIKSTFYSYRQAGEH
jgi:hypothetical protein